MTTIRVTGVAATKAAVKKIRRAMSRTNPLFTRIGRRLRDDARRRITTQDNGNYPGLSKWTRARTGRRKALITERKNITFKVIRGNLIVGHQADGDWTIEQHEKGFVTPGFTKPVTITLKNPSALKDVTGNSITIRGAKASVVPARRVFATEAEAGVIIQDEADKWLRDIIRRST